MDAVASKQTFKNDLDDFNIDIKVNTRAKRMRLVYDPVDGAFRLSTPVHATSFEINAFLRRCRDWMERQLIEKPVKREVLGNGSVLNILGKTYIIEFHLDIRSGFELTEDTLIIRGPKSRQNIILENSLKDLIQKILYQRCVVFAGKLDRKINQVSVRDQKTRWGSCNHLGNLSFSWRLIFAPDQVVDYICIHEVAHLVEMNHSDKFWAVVEKLDPHYNQARLWLKKNGKNLLSIHFHNN